MATPAITTWSPDAPTLAALQAWRADADAMHNVASRYPELSIFGFGICDP